VALGYLGYLGSTFFPCAGCEIQQTIAVGDGANDIPMLHAAGPSRKTCLGDDLAGAWMTCFDLGSHQKYTTVDWLNKKRD